VKFVVLVTDPPKVVIAIFPVTAPVGTFAVTWVSEFTVTLVAWSRLFLAVHDRVDVYGGVALGIGIGGLVAWGAVAAGWVPSGPLAGVLIARISLATEPFAGFSRPFAIAAGAFHNDVVAVANERGRIAGFLIAVAVTCLIALPFGFIFARLSGAAAAIATLAGYVIAITVIANWTAGFKN